MPTITPVTLAAPAKMTNASMFGLFITVAPLVSEPPSWQFELYLVKNPDTKKSGQSLGTRIFREIPDRDEVKNWVGHWSPSDEITIEVVENALRLIGMLYQTEGVFVIDHDPLRFFFRIPTEEDDTWGIRLLRRDIEDKWSFHEITSARRTNTEKWRRREIIAITRRESYSLAPESYETLLDELERLCPDAFLKD